MAKKILFAPLLVAAAGLLAACSTDTIVARPKWQDESIIDVTDIKDNKLKVIYDAIKGLGDTNANVLNKILYKISAKNIGYWHDKDIKGLEQFDNDKTVNELKDILVPFINEHPIYKTKETKLVKSGGSSIEIKEGDDNYLQISLNMIRSQIEEIKENIAEKLYDDIKGGSYSVDNIFYEERFLMNLYKNLYEMPGNPSDSTTHAGFTWKSGILLPRAADADITKKESWSTYIKKYLTLETENNNNKWYDDYIKMKIIPDIYQSYLIQTYVKEQRYSNISRSYARKVKMITIANGGTKYKDKILALMKNFVSTNIIKDSATEVSYNFDLLENCMRGFVGTDNGAGGKTPEYSAMETAGFTVMTCSKTGETNPVNLKISYKDPSNPSEIKSTCVFKGTKLGDLIEKLEKVCTLSLDADDKLVLTRKRDIDSSAYNDLTNSGAYSLEHGLELKVREIHLTTFAKEGWYLKNGGLSDLNSDIRDRLFSIQTSNQIDSNKEYVEGNYIKYYGSNKHAFLFGKIGGQSTEDVDRIVLNDGTNYHIIEVEEAISTSKMSDSSNDGSYMYKKAGDNAFDGINKMNEIVYNVVKSASTGDTYKKTANQYYLMMANILFYDQSVYDYFKSQYPDLFK